MQKKHHQEYNKENMASASVRAASISLRHSIEICNFIRKKKVNTARKMMEDILQEKMAVPFKRFTSGAGHKKGIGPGQYPKKAAAEFIRLLNVVEANAQNKGMSASGLEIEMIRANKAPTQWHYGRKRGRKMKRTHIDIYVKEGEKKKAEDKKDKRSKEGAKKER